MGIVPMFPGKLQNEKQLKQDTHPADKQV